jgi:hypothetical protein
VNGFGVFGNDLIVSKKGDEEKKLYRINVADVPANWVCIKLSSNNAAQNAHSIVGAFNNVYFVDSNGFKSIAGVTEYGDLQVDLAGAKVNTIFGSSVCSELTYIPMFTALWYFTGDRIYAYHRISTGTAFTELQFSQGQINSAAQVGTVLYLAGNNGYLYKIDSTLETDEVSPGVTSAYVCRIVGKRYDFPGGGILKRTSVDFKPVAVSSASSAYIRVKIPDGRKILIKTVQIKIADEELYDALEDLSTAVTELAAAAGAAWPEVTTNKVRSTSIQFMVDSNSGRFGLEGLAAEVVMVGS